MNQNAGKALWSLWGKFLALDGGSGVGGITLGIIRIEDVCVCCLLKRSFLILLDCWISIRSLLGSWLEWRRNLFKSARSSSLGHTWSKFCSSYFPTITIIGLLNYDSVLYFSEIIIWLNSLYFPIITIICVLNYDSVLYFPHIIVLDLIFFETIVWDSCF